LQNNDTVRLPLLEAIDAEQMNRALKALSFMRKIDFSAIPAISDAIKSSVDDLNNSLTKDSGIIKNASDVVSRAFQALKARSTAPLKTPIGRAIDIATTISNGFGAMPGIIDANVQDPGAAADKTLTDAVTGRADAVQSLIKKAFSGENVNSERVADDMMHIKLSVIADLTKKIRAGSGARDALGLIDKALKAKQTGASKPEEPKHTTPSKQTTPTKPTTGATTSKTVRDENLAALKRIQRSSGLDQATFSKALKAIIDGGYSLSKKPAARS